MSPARCASKHEGGSAVSWVIRAERGCLTPDAAVRAVPARVLLSCLLFRSLWLMVEGDRHFSAAGVLHRRADGQPWPCASVWLLAFQTDADFLAGSVPELFRSAAK
jgi:hypothetical protein